MEVSASCTSYDASNDTGTLSYMRLWWGNTLLDRMKTRIFLHNNLIYIDLCVSSSQEKCSGFVSIIVYVLLLLNLCKLNIRGHPGFVVFRCLWIATLVFGAAANLFQYKWKVTRLCHFSLCVKELQKAILSSCSLKSPFYYSNRRCQFKKACYKWINLWQDCWLTGKSLLCMDLTS